MGLLARIERAFVSADPREQMPTGRSTSSQTLR